jgi:hypothetical protein
MMLHPRQQKVIRLVRWSVVSPVAGIDRSAVAPIQTATRNRDRHGGTRAGIA